MNARLYSVFIIYFIRGCSFAILYSFLLFCVCIVYNEKRVRIIVFGQVLNREWARWWILVFNVAACISDFCCKLLYFYPGDTSETCYLHCTASDK